MFASYAIAAGRSVVISNSRGPETLGEVVAALGPGARAGSVAEAAAADIVMIAVPWWKSKQVLHHLPPFHGRILIDPMNALDSYEPFRPTDLGGRVSSEIVADLVPDARVVKAFNTAPVAAFEPKIGAGRTVVFLSGDDTDAKRTVADIVEAVGFVTIDLGSLATGGRLQQLGGPIAGKRLIALD